MSGIHSRRQPHGRARYRSGGKRPARPPRSSPQPKQSPPYSGLTTEYDRSPQYSSTLVRASAVNELIELSTMSTSSVVASLPPESPTEVREALAGLASTVQFVDMPADEVTRLLTHTIVDWGIAYGWMPALEVASRAVRGEGDGRRGHHGYLDIVLERWGLPPVVVEIDRGNKQWSVDKLEAERAAGSICLWVRWSKKTPTAPSGIEVVHVPVTATPGSPRLYSTAQ